MYSYHRYRQAFVWEDKTIDYFSQIVRWSYKVDEEVKCAVVGITLGQVGIIKCRETKLIGEKGDTERSVCQMPDTEQSQRAQPLSSAIQKAQPSVALANVTSFGEKGHGWWVTCPSDHVTHTFLACDVSAFCWAGWNLTFSLLPELWALPVSWSCPAPMTFLPPSFPCRSEEQRVPYSLVCDHRQDCADGSDEKFCTFLPCQWQTEFQCQNKQVCCTQQCHSLNKFIYFKLSDTNDALWSH